MIRLFDPASCGMQAYCCSSRTALRAALQIPPLQLAHTVSPWSLRHAIIALQVDCDVGAPQVNYRESISQLADIKYTHKKQSGGSGQFAEVAIRFEPGEPGTGFEFRSEIKGGTVPKEYIPGVTKVGLHTLS